MIELTYDRQAAKDYARKWAYNRNPDYYDFSAIGGDCTNFASQCLLAGSYGVMNYAPTYGWYYRSVRDRAPAWTGVTFLYNFITANTGVGPYGYETSISRMEPGDIVQLSISGGDYHHSPVIVDILKEEDRTLDDILVAAHTYDTDRRPLSTYSAQKIRFLHIEGVRKNN